MTDREVAARLATLRRTSVDLERRLRADDFSSSDSCEYWRSQIDSYRADIDGALDALPFPQRAIQQVPRVSEETERGAWPAAATEELAEIRTRLDTAIARLG